MAPTKKTTTVAKPKAATAHPPFAEMIKNCIVESADRQGVSRPAIKKYCAEKHNMVWTASNLNHLNKAISRGAETGLFDLPKGSGGRVKLQKKTKTAVADKENSPPAKKAAPAKKAPAVKEAPKKAAAPKTATKAAPKKPAAKSAAPAKKDAPAKKTTAAAKTKAAATGKKAAPTKAAPKKAAAKK